MICAECKHFDPTERDSYGKYWCKEYREYVWGDADAEKCGGFWEDRWRSTSDINSYSSSGGGCFCTVAAMFGLKDQFRDDGYHLATIRKARDICRANGRYVEDIEKYYEISPQIVAKINSRKDKEKIYIGIFKEFVEPFVALVEKEQYEDAYIRFCSVRDALVATYCPELA